MKKLKFTFLTNKQIFGNKKLDIFNKYGIKAFITDFSILLGGSYRVGESSITKNYIGEWWTKDPYCNLITIVDYFGTASYNRVYDNKIGVRPVIPYSSIFFTSFNKQRNNQGILEVEFGEYPQDIVSEDLSIELENLYLDKTINKTGKNYTTDFISDTLYENITKSKTHIEYEYNDKKYIRFVGNSICEGEKLSDGRFIKKGKPYWVEVKPIKWLIDEKTGLALCEKIVFAGIKFNGYTQYIYNFKTSNIKKFMDNYFAKEIIPVEIKNKGKSDDLEETKKEYITGINASSEKEINIKLKGNNEKIIEILKKIRDEEIEVSLIPDKNQTRVRTHYGYRI